MQEPQHTLGLSLANICRLHHARIHMLLESVGLYRGQPPLLFALWHQDGQTHSELAERLHVTPATITRMIQRMEKTGFLERQRDEEDQRVSRVFLTPSGRDIRTRVDQIFAQFEAETFNAFNDDELAALCDFLQRIRNNLEVITREDKENQPVNRLHD